MKTRNKHGRVGVKTPLSSTEKRAAHVRGYMKGWHDAKNFHLATIKEAKSLRDLKKQLGL